MTNQAHEIRDGSIGIGSGIVSAIMGWLKPLGEVASSVGSIVTCIIACVMLYRILRKKD
jgi:tetrahydromethanopterin S-methyltransferase subunit C